MGSPVSAVVANLYMEFFKELALESAPARPRLWKRYMDDMCCIVKKGTAEELLHHLNSVRPTIKFTVELEKALKMALFPSLTPTCGGRRTAPLASPCTGNRHTLTGTCTSNPTIQSMSGEVSSDVSTTGPRVSPPQRTAYGRRRTTWPEF